MRAGEARCSNRMMAAVANDERWTFCCVRAGSSLNGEDGTAKPLRHAEKGAPRARGCLTGAFYGKYEGRVRPEDVGGMPQEPEAQRREGENQRQDAEAQASGARSQPARSGAG